MYRDKQYRVRTLKETLSDVHAARAAFGPRVEKVFVADGDALAMDAAHWEAILAACREAFPRLRRVSAYATAMNLLAKSVSELTRLKEQGLVQLYIGPETGDDVTLKRIAKGASFAEHVEAARRAHAAGMTLSTIFLLGVGGIERSEDHANASARLVSEMDPAFFSLLTLTVVPQTPMARLEEKGRFELPSVHRMLEELRTIVALAEPTGSVFRTNHASNYLPLGGVLPRCTRAHPLRRGWGAGRKRTSSPRVGARAVIDPMKRLFFGSLFVSAMLLAPRPVRGETRTETQYWTAAFLTARITGETPAEPGMSGWFDVHGRFGEDRSVAIVRPGLGYRFSGFVSGWVGYAWVPTWVDEAPTIHEHRIWQQAILQGTEGILRYQIRPRVEQRLREGQDDVGLRFRLFVRANFRLMDQVPLDVATWDELFFGLNETTWGQVGGFDQNRVFLGLSYTFGAIRTEAGYLNVAIHRLGGSWLIQHNPMISLSITL
jgi:hypothetical protein